jgi:hypothetical protein
LFGFLAERRSAESFMPLLLLEGSKPEHKKRPAPLRPAFFRWRFDGKFPVGAPLSAGWLACARITRSPHPRVPPVVRITRDTGRPTGDPGSSIPGRRAGRLSFGVATKVFFFVATLGYSRRLHVRAFGHEKQESWFAGMVSTFQAFGGIAREVLLDNARALVLHHDPSSR